MPEIPFVDREDTLGLLIRAVESARQARGSAFFVTGPIGCGKTRLARELINMEDSLETRVMYASCRRDTNGPYLPVVSAIEDHVARQRAKKVEVSVLSLLGFENKEPETLGPDVLNRERTRMLEFLLSHFSSMSSEKVLILIFDDIHAADSGTLAFFHYLARNIGKERIVLIGIYQEEIPSELSIFIRTLGRMKDENLSTTVTLSPLSYDHTAKLASDVLGTWKIDPSLFSWIHERTSGNPLFIIELSKAVREHGYLEDTAGKLKVKAEEVSIPNSISEIIKLRLGNLLAKERAVLFAASVLERGFRYEALMAVSELSEDDTLEVLDRLLGRGLLSEDTGCDETYSFTNNTISAVLYADLDQDKKALYHKRAAIHFEKTGVKNPALWPVITRHYRIAGDTGKSIEFGMLVGERALRNYAVDEALFEFKECARLIPSGDARRPTVLVKMSDVMELSGDHVGAINALDEAMSILSDKTQSAQIHRKKGAILSNKGDPDSAEKECMKALEVLGEGGDPVERGTVMRVLAKIGFTKGDWRSCMEWAKLSVATIPKIPGNEGALSTALNQLGVAYVRLHELEKALESYREGLALAEKINDEKMQATFFNNMGRVIHDMGDNKTAIDYFDKSFRLSNKVHDISVTLSSQANLAMMYALQGNYQKSVTINETVVMLADKVGIPLSKIGALNNIGLAHSILGNFDRAIQTHTEGLAISEKLSSNWYIFIHGQALGLALLEKGDHESARRHLERSIEYAEKTGDTLSIGEGKVGLALLESEEGKNEEAMELVQTCIEAISERGLLGNAPQTTLDSAHIYINCGAIGAAEKLLLEVKAEAAKQSFFENWGLLYCGLGRIASSRKKWDEAERYFTDSEMMMESLQQRRDLPKTLYYHGIALSEQKKGAYAREFLERALEMFRKQGQMGWLRRCEDAIKKAP